MFAENNRAERRRVGALRRQGLNDAEIANVLPRHRPPPPRPEGADPLLDSVAVRAHLGGCSEMSLWRWTRNNGFPEPDLRLNGRKLWRLSTVDGWINAIAQNKSPPAAEPPHDAGHDRVAPHAKRESHKELSQKHFLPRTAARKSKLT
jgi:predicted DNA-binding transcriptional regulator AlpA